jgi:two-component system cell cycle response regulator CtrA
MDEPELKIVDVFICKLRKKIYELTDKRGYIETIWGRGYMLKDPADNSQYIASKKNQFVSKYGTN